MDLKKIIDNHDGLWIPNPGTELISLTKVYQDMPKQTASRIERNQIAETIIDTLSEGDINELSNDVIIGLNNYTGIAGMESFYNNHDETDFSFPTWMYNGIYRAIEELGCIDKSILFHNPGLGRIIGLLPNELRDAVSNGDLSITVVNEYENNSTKACRLLYPGIPYYHKDNNVITRNENIGISGYAKIIENKHGLIISQNPNQGNWGHLIDSLQEGGYLIALVSPLFNDGPTFLSERAIVAAKADVIGIMRTATMSIMENSGIDMGYDIMFIRKPTKIDDIYRTILNNFPLQYRYTIASIKDGEIGKNKKSVEDVCSSQEMFKQINNLANQANVSVEYMFYYLQRILKRGDMTDKWMSTNAKEAHARELYGKKSFSIVMSMIKRKLKEIVDKDELVKSDYNLVGYNGVSNRNVYANLVNGINKHITGSVDEFNSIKDIVISNPLWTAIANIYDGKPRGGNSYYVIADLIKVIEDIDDFTLHNCGFDLFYYTNNWFQLHGTISQASFDLYHSPKLGFYYVPTEKVDFMTEAHLFKKYLWDYQPKAEVKRIDDVIYLDADNVTVGSIILHESMVLKKLNLDENVLVTLACEKVCERFGIDCSNRVKSFSNQYTLVSIYTEAKQWSSKTEDVLGELENKLYGIAKFALKDHDDAAVLELQTILQLYFYLGETNRYKEIGEISKEDGEYEKLVETIIFINKLVEIRNKINDGINTDDNKLAFVDSYTSFLKQNKLSKMTDHPTVIKYFKNLENEAASDDRWFILKSFDKAYAKKKGIFGPLNVYDEYNVFFDAVSYLNEVCKKPDYRVRVNVKTLLENGEKYNNTGIYPTSMFSHSDRLEFIQQATATGEWIVDVEMVEKGEYLLKKERFVFGNIGKKLKMVKAFENKCMEEGIDTDVLNIPLIATELQNKILQIPNIPEAIIDFDPHQSIINIDEHIVPFFSMAFGKVKVFNTDFKIDKTENEGFGRYKYYGKPQDAEISGWTLNSVPVKRHMLIRWFNMESEEKADTDQHGKPLLDKKGKIKLINDVDLTSERNDFLRERFNDYLKNTLHPDKKNDLCVRYNECYQIYVPKFSDEAFHSEGMSDQFRGKPFKPNSFQYRFANRFLSMHRLYGNHHVGSGKTISALLSGWEAKQRGLINKPMYVVLLKNISQWEMHIKELFPSANYLIINNANKRQSLCDISVNDYDFVVIPDSTWSDIIDLSAEFKAVEAKNDLEKYFEVKEYLENEYLTNPTSRTIVKPQLKTVTQYINRELRKIEHLLAKTKNDFIEMSFNKLGIDALIVDESDVYKNVDTGMDSYLQTVKGIRRVSSRIAQTMRMASNYIQKKYNYCNRIDMTGTPVSNSATEIYQTLNSITPDLLIDAGINTFNDFISAHGKVEPVEIVNTQNQIEARPTFVGMRNTNQVKRLINACFDVLDQKTLNDIKRAQGEPIPTPVFNSVTYPSTPEKILMNHYSQHQVKVMKQLAQAPPEVKAQRTARKNEVKRLLKQQSSALAAKMKFDINDTDIKALKSSISELEEERRILSFNGGVLYNQIRSGIVHTKLYNEFIDDGNREHSKIKKVVQVALNSFLYTGEWDEIVNINGLDVYKKGDEYRCVKNGQLFFMDRMSRTDIDDFNARDEYIKAIKAGIPDELYTQKQKDKMFACIDATSSEPIDIKKVKKLLFEYFEVKDENYQQAVKFFEHASSDGDEDDFIEIITKGTKVKKVKKISYRDIVKYLYNKGFYRFIFGSTDSMGVGMDLQVTTTDEYNIDLPFRPRDWEQRIGRGLRQGNLNSKMHIHSFSSEGGSETVMMQVLRIKENFIHQIFDLKLLDDFTAEAAISGIKTGDIEEQSIFLSQLDSMIHDTNDTRIQTFVDQRKELESLINRQKMFLAVIENHRSNLRRLEEKKGEIEKDTETYLWLMYDILPAIIEKEKLQEQYDDEYAAAMKELKASENYKLAIKRIEDKYADLIKRASSDRVLNNITYAMDTEIAQFKKNSIPDCKKVEDFSNSFKISVVRQFPWNYNFNREMADIFFNCKVATSTNIRGVGRVTYTDYDKIFTGELHESEFKELTTYSNYLNTPNTYYLGQFSRVVRQKLGLISRVMDGEISAVEQFEMTLLDQDYLNTIKKADESINSENGIAKEIFEKREMVLENQDAYYTFIEKQEKISEYAGYLVEQLETIETLEDRMAEIDGFVLTKQLYEKGELSELPTPEDWVDRKLLV
jgi:hypothetical protein